MLFFAGAKDAAGLASETIPLSDTATEKAISIAELFKLLEERHPKLSERKILSSVAVAINLKYVDISCAKVKAGDEVAIIPPVSGG